MSLFRAIVYDKNVTTRKEDATVSGQILSAVPILISNDFDGTVAFYQQFGFHEVDRYDRDYLIIRCDGLELHFVPRPDHDPANSWHSAYVRILNVKALTRQWQDLSLSKEGIPRYVPASLKPWGMIEAHIVDPDGNLLNLGAANEEFTSSRHGPVEDN